MGKVRNVKLILISITLLLSLYPHGKTDAKYRDTADSTFKNQILETVVQIRAYALSPNSGLDDQGQVQINAGGDPERVIEIEYSVAKGLGTLVSTGNERVIVTHNHWGDMLAEMRPAYP